MSRATKGNFHTNAARFLEETVDFCGTFGFSVVNAGFLFDTN